ncbi:MULTISPECIES: PAS domain-containing protein [Streptomyces]|uniref:PAS domain-containing protein n=1 Tax=Streptomyces fungicidicus TaxID=68203 RepID=A0ACC7XUT0_9ACTN|nr:MULTISPECIES: PAS domain-containing protein [Streptomyces]MBF4132557.1 PAS domain-containing protein [Streptomyces albidoflavus]NUV73324.1 PAS domain-containing protein [Streptomyces fungicidicus]PAX83603.1 histidine kinase [Streptomyces albidoflavus]PAX87423.1 histidine kinase [Streptomyces albidoflavus]PBO19942.1 histidine kinase [Streptomyces albidoflavus]
MSSRSPVSPAAETSVRGSVRALIDGTRRVRGALDAVRQGAEGGEPDPPRRRALYDLALRQLDDVGGHLGRLSEGWPGAVPPAAPGGAEATEGSAEWDLLTDEVCWSPELYRVLGREAGSRVLSLDELPSLLLPEDQPLLTAMVTDCLIDGRPMDGAFRVVRGDGTVRTLHMNGAPVLDEYGSTASLRAVLRDVTATGTPVGRTGATPPPPPAPAGPAARTTTAVRELPPGPDAAADRTWCDTLTLPDGRTLLAVGERPSGLSRDLLVGTVRGLVAGGETPQDALELAAALLPGADPVGRALCCVHDPVTGALDWGRTDGHPAPLLRHDGVALPLDHGGPGEHLLPGDLLLLHTTGTGHDSSTDLLQALPLPLDGHLDADTCADLAADALAGAAGPSEDGQRGAARVIAVRVGSGAGQAGHG